MSAVSPDTLARGDVAEAQQHLEAHPEDLDARNGDGVSLLLLCLYHGRQPLAAWIAARRTRALDVFEAAAIGDEARLVALLAEDASLVGACNHDGFAPLGLAAFFGRPACARRLLDAGAPVDEPAANPMHVRPLHSAAAARQHEIARWLLAGGADVNARQQGGFTALHAAAQHGDLALVQLLLEHGADHQARNDVGATPLDLSRAAGHRDVVRLLQARSS